MTLEEMKNRIVSNNKLVKLTNADIEKISIENNLTETEVKELYAKAKESFKSERALAKLEKFMETHCCFVYNDRIIDFKPTYVESEKINEFGYAPRAILWKTNLDKNAIYYITMDNKGLCVINSMACVSSKSKTYDYRKALVDNNKALVESMLHSVLDGVSFDNFFKKCEKFNGFKKSPIKGVLKNIVF